MTWKSTTNFDQPPEPQDLVDELREADREAKKQIEGAMIIPAPHHSYGERSLLERAADEIEKLRRCLGMLEN